MSKNNLLFSRIFIFLIFFKISFIQAQENPGCNNLYKKISNTLSSATGEEKFSLVEKLVNNLPEILQVKIAENIFQDQKTIAKNSKWIKSHWLFREDIPNYAPYLKRKRTNSVYYPNLSIARSPFNYGNVLTYNPINATKNLSRKKELRVMTLNAEHLNQPSKVIKTEEASGRSKLSNQGKLDRDKVAIGNVIKAENPDIVVLQEVENLLALTEFLKVNALDSLYMPMILYGNNNIRDQHIAFLVPKNYKLFFTLYSFSELTEKETGGYFGNKEKKIFSRDFPVLVVSELDQHHAGKTLLYIGGVHSKSMIEIKGMMPTQEVRKKQMEASTIIAQKVIEQLGRAPFLFAGDFNSNLKALENESLYKFGAVDTLDYGKIITPIHKRYTYIYQGKADQIDAIMLKAPKRDVKKIVQKSWIHQFPHPLPTDHNAVFVEFNFSYIKELAKKSDSMEKILKHSSLDVNLAIQNVVKESADITPYATKQAFAIWVGCSKKIFYAANGMFDFFNINGGGDLFQESLLIGGKQVHAYAKCHYPMATQIRERSLSKSLEKTVEVLKNNEAVETVLGSTFILDQMLIKPDILHINEDTIELIEVKSKSINRDKKRFFFNINGTISADWKEYAYELSFQAYILEVFLKEKGIVNAKGERYKVHPYFMLLNKDKVCPSEGLFSRLHPVLNNKGEVVKVDCRTLEESDLYNGLIIKVDAEELVQVTYKTELNGINFRKQIEAFNAQVKSAKKFNPQVELGKKCKGCPAIEKCWGSHLKLNEGETCKDRNLTFNVWKLSNADALIKEGKITMEQLAPKDLNAHSSRATSGLSDGQRRWLQVNKATTNDKSIYFDKVGIIKELKKHKYPLTFIDFETAISAVPFHRGRRPYESIVFMFSLHILHKNGKVEHKLYIKDDPSFPNYDVARALMKWIPKTGSIFQYSQFENTTLVNIIKQLKSDPNVIPDKRKLINFIKTITHDTPSQGDSWKGMRDMVDLLEVVKRYYFDPDTKGSNSIKEVLPSILNRSSFLQKHYSAKSKKHNRDVYMDFPIVQFDENHRVIDPYKHLNDYGLDVSPSNKKFLPSRILTNAINNGGAAIAAYKLLIEPSTPEDIKKSLRDQLVRYNKLDTLAEMILYQGLVNWGLGDGIPK